MAQRNPIPDDRVSVDAATGPDASDATIETLTEEEGRAYFDERARRLLGISGEEFLDRYAAGEYWGETDFDRYHKINELIMIMPIGVKVTIDDDGRFRPVR